MSLAETMRLAARTLARSPRRTVLTGLALANAVAGGLLFYGFTRHTYWGLAESFARSGNGHVQVAAQGWFDAAAPEAHRVERARLEAVATAAAADPVLGPLLTGHSLRRQLNGMLVAEDRSGVFVGVGTDPTQEAALAPLSKPVAGRALDGPDQVLLGATLAERLAVQPGDSVTALVTTDAGMTDAMDLHVVGVARTGSDELDRMAATLPLDTALSLAGSDRADLLVLALGDTDDTDIALARTQALLAADPALAGLDARPWHDRHRYYIAVRALYDRIFGIFEALMVLVTALSLSHAIAAVVAERRQEIALLRVVGLTRRQVAGLFVAEGALLGVLGGVGGALLANLVAVIVKQAGGLPMPPPPGFTVGYAALFHLDLLGYLIVLPASVLAAMIASAVPALRASRGPLSRTLAGLVLLFALLPPALLAMSTDAHAQSPPSLPGEDPQAEVAEARRLLAATDEMARPRGLCRVELTVTGADDDGQAVTWRMLLSEDRALGITTSLEPGKRQVVLRTAQGSWYQTERMNKPLRARGGQRIQARLALGDLLQPALSQTWEPTALVHGSAFTRVQAVAKSEDAPTPAAELVFDAAATQLVEARFLGRGGEEVRVARWRRVDGLRELELTEAGRKDRSTLVRLGQPACVEGTLDVDAAGMLAAGQALAADAGDGADGAAPTQEGP